MGRLETAQGDGKNGEEGEIIRYSRVHSTLTEILVRIGSVSSKDFDLKQAASYEE